MELCPALRSTSSWVYADLTSLVARSMTALESGWQAVTMFSPEVLTDLQVEGGSVWQLSRLVCDSGAIKGKREREGGVV